MFRVFFCLWCPAAVQGSLHGCLSNSFVRETSRIWRYGLYSGDPRSGEIPTFCRAPEFPTTMGIPARSHTARSDVLRMIVNPNTGRCPCGSTPCGQARSSSSRTSTASSPTVRLVGPLFCSMAGVCVPVFEGAILRVPVFGGARLRNAITVCNRSFPSGSGCGGFWSVVGLGGIPPRKKSLRIPYGLKKHGNIYVLALRA